MDKEAVEKLAGIIVDSLYRQDDDSRGYGPAVDSSDRAAQAILAAIQADPLAYVKPKPLEWGPKGVGNRIANSMGYIYFAESDEDGEGTLWIKPKWGDWSFTLHPTLEAAQSAAETHRNEMLAKEFEG